MSFALGCSHLPKNSILLAKRQFSACFSNCSISLNFKDKINCNTTKQNDLKWGKTYTGLKFDLVHFNGPQTKFICDSLYKHPVDGSGGCGGPVTPETPSRGTLGRDTDNRCSVTVTDRGSGVCCSYLLILTGISTIYYYIHSYRDICLCSAPAHH